MTATATVSAKGEARVRAGHPWIYRSDVEQVAGEAGEVVAVRGPRQRPLGHAFFSDRSQITLRMLSAADAPAPDPAFWRQRLEAAIAFRATLGIDATAYRLVHGEADLLPSLIVDRYGEVLVVQALSQGADRLLPELLGVLVELTGATGVLARNDSKVRELEELPRSVEVLYGEVPEQVEVVEGDVTHEVDLRHGQKTGLFLDQRENHAAAASYANGRVLDAFSYTGGFALALARRAEHVEALDISADAVARITANAARNRLANIESREGNAFDELRQLDREGAHYDTVVLDPPAFAKTRAALPKALAGYKEINLRALRLLRPGGTLVTCSCSYHLDEATFGQVVHEAALDSRSQVTVVEKRMQARDHPVLLGVPETSYLKCLILRKLG